MTISDSFVLCLRNSGFVLLLQVVIVACAFLRRFAIGFPTILLVPITVTIFQSSSIFSLLNISMIPPGVHGVNNEWSHTTTFPWFIG
jgi:hypothetical protein